ncbi:hypothetical protein LSAT2_012340 [Lamellibrachia satsuma]|nr:hypothetical protein LSAT2_012340 [Lamellibrachia satsuma]
MCVPPLKSSVPQQEGYHQPSGPSTATTDVPVAPLTPVYQEVWFIAIMAIMALILLFIVLAVCVRASGATLPYIRERMPLQARQQKAALPLAYCGPYDASIVTTEIPHHPGSLASGCANPGYSHVSLASRHGSLTDINLDRLSQKSSHWGDEDTDDEIPWEGLLPDDSGLHSLAYGDDYDEDSDRPVSILKEHTMFTDTHV